MAALRLKVALAAVMAVSLFAGPAPASTLVLEGEIDNVVTVRQTRRFAVPGGGLDTLSFRFASPVDAAGPAITQKVSGRSIKYNPAPASVRSEKDALGNTFTVVTWEGLKEDAEVEESFRAAIDIKVKGAFSAAPFPMQKVPGDVSRYLKPSPMVESGDPGMTALARSLTRGAATEQEAVTGVLNWVVDNIKYRTPVPEYGAVWTLRTRQGNCQNFSHLSIALLRAAGVPARIVGGISIGKSWSVPLKDGTLLQSIGQGGHAWIEVWYQDLGWVPYDAQQSHLFVGPRHIKQTVGRNADDINDSWRASPVLPRFSEDISAEYAVDRVALKLKDTFHEPGSYIMTSSLALAPEAQPLTGTRPAPPAPPEPAPTEVLMGKVVIGNLDFPSLVHYYASTEAGAGQKTFDKETAEYVTGEHTFAQAFIVEEPMRIELVSLAMHKFGGRHGSLWIDVVKDASGRPGTEGDRSLPLVLDKLKFYPGYRWFDFRFFGAPAKGPILTPGVYWIILRHSRDAIVNWFYTPGNRYGSEGDTRSTKSGIDFAYVLNADFNFRVTGTPASPPPPAPSAPVPPAGKR